MKGVSWIHADQMTKWDCQVEVDGKWVAGRPEGMGGFVHRIKMAYLVFTGNADAIFWHKQ